jgi:hypothetical protein
MTLGAGRTSIGGGNGWTCWLTTGAFAAGGLAAGGFAAEGLATGALATGGFGAGGAAGSRGATIFGFG